jgi:tetratricopeptide (TPR) repeat protein
MGRTRLTVFVSSKMKELAEERQIIKHALDELEVNAFVFEADAGARPGSIRSTYLDELESSDLYVGLFWNGYGEWTQDEFNQARKMRKDCLLYEKRTEIDERDPRLQAFLDIHNKVQPGLTIRWFEQPDQLAEFVKEDVADVLAKGYRRSRRSGLGVPFQVPPLSDQYIERFSVLDRLKRKLLTTDDQGTPLVTRAALHGIGGIGKSVIARAFAHGAATAERFPDGSLWVELGETPDLPRRLTAWGRALGDPQLGDTGYADLQTAVSQLRTLLADKKCLLVVDDAWSSKHVKEAFLVGGPNCLLLVTTRLANIADDIGATRIELEVMSSNESLALMESWAGDSVARDRPTASWLADEVGHLPLALELIGAQVNRLGSWSECRERWQQQRLLAVKRGRGAVGKENNLLDSIGLSFGSLSNEDQANFRRFGVFGANSFTRGAVTALVDCDDFEAADFLTDLTSRALLSRQQQEDRFHYSFHAVIRQFLLAKLGDTGLHEAHHELVEGYRRRYPDGWWSALDDGYFHDHLSYHLVQAGKLETLYELLSKPWLQAQFDRIGSHAAFSQDVDRIMLAARSETPPNIYQFIKAGLTSATLSSIAGNARPSVLAALVRLDQADRAWDWAALMQDRTLQSAAYRRIADAHLAQGQSELGTKALALALEAASERAIFSSIWENALIDTCVALARTDHVAIASRVAGIVVEVAEINKENLATQAGIISRAAQVYAAAGDSEALYKMALAASRFSERPAEVAAMAGVASAFVSVGDLSTARDLASRAMTTAQAISDETGLENLAELAEVLAEAGARVQCIDLSASILARVDTAKDAYRASIVSRLSRVYTRVGASDSLDLILQQARAIASPAFRIAAMSEIAATNAEAGEWVRARAIADEIGEESRKLTNGERFPNAAIGEAVRSLAKAGFFDEAFALANLMPNVWIQVLDEPWDRAAALGEIAVGLVSAGKKVQAQHLVNTALRISATTEATTAEVLALSSIAESLLQSGRKEYAQEAAKDAFKVARKLGSNWDRAPAFTRLYRTFTKVGDPVTAEVVVQSTLDLLSAETGSFRGKGLCSLSKALLAEGVSARAVEVALSALSTSESPADKATTLIDVAGVVAAAQESAKARQMIAEAQEIGRELDLLKQAEVMHNASRVLVQLGELTQARDLVDRALLMARDGKNGLMKEFELESFAETFWTMGDCDQARKLVDELGIPLKFARFLAESGDVQTAKDIVDGAKVAASGHYRADDLQSIFAIIRRTGTRVDALHALIEAVEAAKPWRTRVLSLLESAAPLLASNDGGETLWRIRETVLDVDSWW